CGHADRRLKSESRVRLRPAGDCMLARFSRRYLDILGSIYIYNEHRGYTALYGLLEGVRQSPRYRDLTAAIEKHAADERRHYLMFQHWYETRRQMPLFVDRACGHID